MGTLCTHTLATCVSIVVKTSCVVRVPEDECEAFPTVQPWCLSQGLPTAALAPSEATSTTRERCMERERGRSRVSEQSRGREKRRAREREDIRGVTIDTRAWKEPFRVVVEHCEPSNATDVCNAAPTHVRERQATLIAKHKKSKAFPRHLHHSVVAVETHSPLDDRMASSTCCAAAALAKEAGATPWGPS